MYQIIINDYKRTIDLNNGKRIYTPCVITIKDNQINEYESFLKLNGIQEYKVKHIKTSKLSELEKKSLEKPRSSRIIPKRPSRNIKK